ncbi:MAG TPA: hypothetical protein PK698_06615 [Bacilli bacterium]|jgi:hypothetical protein|nr:hypothetical protein [Bacilli bacterium]
MKIIITESQAKKVIEYHKKGLTEVRYIRGYEDIENQTPLKDDETIIVYHGFSSYSFTSAILIAKYGLSGQEKANRTYSYEFTNNPKGLFVTVNFDTAERNFSGSGIIMEFATKVHNLEAPVWVGGRSYFVQGEYTKSFNDDNEREEQRLKNREKHKTSQYPAINQSDRPELAWALYEGPEAQALFIGNLNPNMIRAFWVNERLITDRRTGGEWIRLSRKEFLKKYYNEEYFKNDEELFKRQNKIFMPDDNFDIIKFKNYLSERDYDYSEFIEYYIKNWDNYVINMYFYPKQINQLKKIYGVE